MKVQANSRFGNFAWVATGEVSDELANALASFGVTQVLQRSPSSNAEKAIAGYEKRPSGFKRDSLPFNVDDATTLRKALENAEIEIGEGENAKTFKLPLKVEVVEYIPTAAESKFTEEKAIVARHREAGDLSEWLESKVKFDGDESDEQAVLAAVREFKKAALKGL